MTTTTPLSKQQHSYSTVSAFSLQQLSTSNVQKLNLPHGSSFYAPSIRLFSHVSARSSSSAPLSSTSLSSSSDEYDDFYAEFDPADYEDINRQYYDQDSNEPSRGRFDGRASSPRGGGRGGGGRRGGGRFGRDNTDGFRGGFDMQRGHDYERDLEADSSRVDISTIDSLLTERLQARKTGQFDIADEIRDQLLDDHGVLVRDKDKIWRSGASRSGSGKKWMSGRNRNDRNARNDRRRPRQYRDGYSDHDEFGSGPEVDPLTGHDYSLAPDAGPIIGDITEDEIHSLLAERLACKLARDFKRADEIQAQLIEKYVLIRDNEKLWRADGKGFSSKFSPKQYTESEYSQSISNPEAQQEIEKLIAKRSLGRAERLYSMADSIKEKLMLEYDVSINDMLLEWSVGGDFGEPTKKEKIEKQYAGYKCAEWSSIPDDVDDIQQMVEQRDVARVKRDFVAADSIREQLMSRGIVVDDDKREWYEVQGHPKRSASEKTENSFTAYKRRGSGGQDLTDEDVKAIQESLRLRNEHKKHKHFRLADEVRDRLRSEYDVRVDDINREWYVYTDEYSMSSSRGIDDLDLQKLIQRKVEERVAARLAKNFDVADEIRYDLEYDYDVIIDDRIKEWYCNTPPATTNSMENNDAEYEGTEIDEEIGEDLDMQLEMVFDEIAEDNYVGSNSYHAADDDDDEKEDETSIDDNRSPTINDFDMSGNGEEDLDINSLTVVQLKDRLREKGLKVSGKKTELIDRLMEN